MGPRIPKYAVNLVVTLLCLSSQAIAASPSPEPVPSPRQIIADARAIKNPNGIEELRQVELGGVKQWISVRGRDRRNPILLFIHGGPASTEMPVSWLYQSPWEDFFTVVQWDQRGAGKTSASNDAAAIMPTISVERMTQDGLELVAHLREHYGKRKIFVLGHSWGTVIGLNIARRQPGWLHAYIGMGQFIVGSENERLGYQFALGRAQRSNNAQAIAELTSIAPYPGPGGQLSLEQIITQRKWVIAFGGLTAGRSDFTYDDNARMLAHEYSDADRAAAGGVGDTLVRLLPELIKVDYRTVTKLNCPVFVLAGRQDFETPSAIAADWLSKLAAPSKKIIWFEHSAHMIQMEQPGRLLMTLVQDVRPIATRAGDAAPLDKAGALQP